jgi:hypothetical protein
MSDLFISYRRDDGGWARGLYAALEDKFDVFLDTDRDSVDYGDDFPRKIADALDECRVCLVLIGPQWVAETNLARLADPKDWVRREIETALKARPRVRVVPILVHTAKFPAAQDLPPTLASLGAEINDLVLTNENWSIACEDLVKRAERWLRGTMPSTATRRGASAYLACLCDRVSQEQSLVDLVTGAAGRPAMACIVHGHLLESHESFLERVRYERLLEDKGMLDARDAGIASCTLQWNRDKAKAGLHGEVLRRALKAAALQRAAASDAELMDYLNALPQPLLALMQVTWSDCEYCGPELLGRFVDAWTELFASPSAAGARIGAKAALLWINLSYDSDDQRLAQDGPLGANLLPRLAPVGESEIYEWAALDDVKRAQCDFLAALNALARDPASYVEPGKLRMQRFVDEVRRIATQP